MNDKVVMLPMSSKKCNMQNKKCDYKTLAIMTLYSNFTPIEMQDEKGVYETYRFLYKNKIIKIIFLIIIKCMFFYKKKNVF